MENIPDKFELDLYLKKMLYKIITWKNDHLNDAYTSSQNSISSNFTYSVTNILDSFEIIFISNGKEDIDEAAKLQLIQNWMVYKKPDIEKNKKKKEGSLAIDSRIRLMDSCTFSEISLNLFIFLD